MKNRFIVLMVQFFALSLVFNPYLFSLQKGSETTVSVEPWVQFPAVDSDNKMLTFGCFKNGFALEDLTTSCTFESIFPVAGTIDLNGGTLHLGVDLFLNNTCAFSTVGTIVGNKHTIHFGSGISRLCGAPSDATYEDADLFISADITVASGVKFTGESCMINGNNNTIILNPGGELVLENGVTVTFKDVHMSGINASNIRCNDGTCKIVFDNVRLTQNGDFTFAQGSFEVSRLTHINGPHTFTFKTGEICTINSDSVLSLENGMTFSYDPVSTTSDLLQFVDDSSVLELNDDTSLYAQADGLVLEKGVMNVRGHAYILGDIRISEQVTDTTHQITRKKVKNKGVVLGRGASGNDFKVRIFDKSLLHIKSGSLIYRNNSSTFYTPGSHAPQLYVDTAARLYLRQSLDLENGLAVFADGAILQRLTAASLIGNVMARGELLSFYAV